MNTNNMKLLAKKTLGQHFLNSAHVLKQIIEAADIKDDQDIIEIGPGTGILTEALIKAGAQVIAIEKDNRAISMLQERFGNEITNGSLKLLEGDVLDDKTRPAYANLDQYSIVANIPYYITGAILEKFLEEDKKPTKMTLLIQKEVAERIVARDKKESILSISVKIFGTPKIIASVPRGAFTPPPKVESAIIQIGNISDKILRANGISDKQFFAVIKTAFAHKRKVAIKNLETIIDRERLLKVWDRLSLDEKIRAEDIPFEKWPVVCREIYMPLP